MNKDGKITILVAIIGVIGTVVSAVIGVKWGKENVTVIVQLDGESVVLSDSDVQNIAQENEDLSKQISEYENKVTELELEINDMTNELEEAKGVLGDTPVLEFQNIGLTIEGEEKNINKENSSVFINGIQYYSREFIDNLLPNDKISTIKDGMFYVGKIVKDKEDFLNRPVIEQAHYSYFYDGIKDTYGNVYGKSIVFEYNGNFTTFNAGREYSYFKCIVAMQDGYKGNGSFQIIADDEVIYTSGEITNMTEVFEVDIPINKASKISIGTIGEGTSRIFVSNAILYNQE